MLLHCTVEMIIAVIWFLLANFIGSHASNRGYMPMTVAPVIDENPFFNFLYKISTPVIFMVLTMVISEKAGIGHMLPKPWVIVILYFCIRYLFIVFVQGRIKLANWIENFIVAAVSAALAWFVYETIIIEKDYLFPTRRDLSNAIWLGVIAFIYKTFNTIRLPHNGTEKRKNRYIGEMYRKIKIQYGSIVDRETQDERIKRVIYAIAVIENFNRPLFYRMIERLLFRFGKAHTLGIMQVNTEKTITDSESMTEGSKKIIRDFSKAMESEDNKERLEKYGEESYMAQVIWDSIYKYNRSYRYTDEVIYVYEYIRKLDRNKKQ
jgi:hypothetical protein